MKYVLYEGVRKLIIESNLRGRNYREMMDGLCKGCNCVMNDDDYCSYGERERNERTN